MPENRQSELEEYPLQSFLEYQLQKNVTVRTSNIIHEGILSCMRELLTLERELPLEECSEILATANFPRKMIT